MATNNRNSSTYDNLTLLKDAGALVASAAATVATVARVIDLGDARMNCKAVVDPSALDQATDELYSVAIQGSADLAFTTPVQLASVEIDSVNRHEVPFSNQIGVTLYRYVRAYLTIGGTTPSINCTIFLAKL